MSEAAPDWRLLSGPLLGGQRRAVDRTATVSPVTRDINLFGCPHGWEAEWPQFISVPEVEMARISRKWLASLVTQQRYILRTTSSPLSA